VSISGALLTLRSSSGFGNAGNGLSVLREG
jgi:hypothetical protein